MEHPEHSDACMNRTSVNTHASAILQAPSIIMSPSCSAVMQCSDAAASAVQLLHQTRKMADGLPAYAGHGNSQHSNTRGARHNPVESRKLICSRPGGATAQ